MSAGDRLGSVTGRARFASVHKKLDDIGTNSVRMRMRRSRSRSRPLRPHLDAASLVAFFPHIVLIPVDSEAFTELDKALSTSSIAATNFTRWSIEADSLPGMTDIHACA